MKQIIANINSQGNPQAEDFKDIIQLLQNSGYEIAWSYYPNTASIIIEIQNEGE